MNNEPLNTTKYVSAIKSTDTFIDNLPRQDYNRLTPAERHTARNSAITKSALLLAEGETAPSGYRSLDGHVFNLVAGLDSFYTAQKRLNGLRARGDFYRLRDQAMPYLEQVTEFNHALKDVIDNGQSIEFDELLTFMARMYAGANGSASMQDFYNEARYALIGMRHEIGAEQIIGTMDDIEYNETDVEDKDNVILDLTGEDIRVEFNDYSIPLDIKASPQAVEKARIKSYYPKSIIWSQCRNQDFGNGFRIPYTVARNKAPAMHKDIEAAALEMTVLDSLPNLVTR